MHLNALARHKGFAWLLLAWLGVMALCSALMYVAEHGINKAIDSPFDALSWGVVTLTTVGYGDVTPVTQENRIAAMALMLLGIGLFGAITATITSYLMSADLRRVEAAVEADVALDRTDLALDVAGDRSDAVARSRAAERTTTSIEGTASASGTLVGELERLAVLHVGGTLTDDEFTRAKERIISTD